MVAPAPGRPAPAMADRVPSAVALEEFRFRGRVDRGTHPAVWIYEHRGSGREMLADADGRTYEFVRYRSGRQLGRFNEIEVWPALLRARLCSRASGVPDHRRIVRRRHLSLVPPCPNPN